MNAKSQPEPKCTASPLLWRGMRRFLLTMFALFGAPQAIATQGVMLRKQHALVLAWLRAGEAFLRRLLFLEALALIDKAPVLQPSAPTTRKPRVRKLVHFYPDKPEDWRVSFHLFEPIQAQHVRSRGRRTQLDPIALARAFRPEPLQRRQNTSDKGAPLDQPAGAAQVRASLAPARRFRNAWPIALRFEAMLRAFNDPHSCARQLAHALQRKADCAQRVLAPQPGAIADLFGRYFGPCDRIAAKRWRAWRPPPAPPDTG